MFSHLLDEENRTARARFKAKELLEEVVLQVKPLNPGVTVDVERVPKEMRLPEAGFAEWSAVFQNIFLNAFNAMRNVDTRRVDISGGSEGAVRWLLVQDTGVGVDLREADVLFEPFERRLDLGPDRAALGLGGSGLGLTIVRMIVEEVDAQVAFIAPDRNHATAIRVSWREAK